MGNSSRRHLASPGPCLATLAIALVVSITWPAAVAQAQPDSDAHFLIADQFNNRVIEVNAETHKVVWTFGNGSDIPGPHSVVGTNDVQRVGPLTLIAGTGIPPPIHPCPAVPIL